MKYRPSFAGQQTIRWLIGIVGSWLCVWLTGPWFVNSILVRVHDPELDTITLREGDLIRWRNEGWAATQVGPHGLPGWKLNAANDKIVIWGDSQVEGFCVNDSDKINNQIIRIASEQYQQSIDCIPMGRSGSDAADWNRLMPAADDLWHPIAHVWIVTELADLLALAGDKKASEMIDRWQAESPLPVRLAKSVHAEAAFQAIRKLFLDPNSGGLRSLRWNVGRVDVFASGQAKATLDQDATLQLVSERLHSIQKQFGDRLVIVYAPAVPRIGSGIVFEHPDDTAWNKFVEIGAGKTFDVIDLRTSFIDHWKVEQRLTRGFQNGTPGFGHLNTVGNRLIAEAIVEKFLNAYSPAIEANRIRYRNAVIFQRLRRKEIAIASLRPNGAMAP